MVVNQMHACVTKPFFVYTVLHKLNLLSLAAIVTHISHLLHFHIKHATCYYICLLTADLEAVKLTEVSAKAGTLEYILHQLALCPTRLELNDNYLSSTLLLLYSNSLVHIVTSLHFVVVATHVYG